MEQSLSWQANWSSASQEIPCILWNQKVHSCFWNSFLPVPYPEQDQGSPCPQPTSKISILILSFHLCLGFPRGLLPSGLPTNTLYAPLLSPVHATYSVHIIILDYITRMFGEEYRSWRSSLCSRVYSSITSSFLGPNIIFSTLFSNNLSLHSSVNVSDHVPHPHKTTSKIIVLYSLIFIFLDSKLEDKRFCTKRRLYGVFAEPKW
jgi:hypothetical protein